MRKTMKLSYFAILSIVCFTSCSMVPQLLSETEHVLDDTAITVKCSQEALSKNSDLKINVELNNSKP